MGRQGILIRDQMANAHCIDPNMGFSFFGGEVHAARGDAAGGCHLQVKTLGALLKFREWILHSFSLRGYKSEADWPRSKLALKMATKMISS